jgi:hypothetical protein
MARKNWHQNPELHDSNSDGTADGVNTNSFSGTPVLSIKAPGAAGTPCEAGQLGNAQALAYTVVPGDSSYAYVRLGQTAAGSFKTTVVDEIVAGSTSVCRTTTAHGLEIGDKLYLSGSSADGIKTVTTKPDTTHFGIAENLTLTGSGRCSPTCSANAEVYWTQTGSKTITGMLKLYQRTTGEATVGTGGSSSSFGQGAWERHTCYCVIQHDDTCDHFSLEFVFNNVATAYDQIQLYVRNVQIEKANGTGDWFDGIYGGDWVGSAHASESTEVQAVVTSMSAGGGQAGEHLTLTGTDFGNNDSLFTHAVLFGTTEASIVSWTPTEIEVIVPNVASGATSVYVQPGNGGGTNAAAVTYTVGKPTITAVTPNTDVYPGDRIVITGTSLGSGGVVSFDTTPAEILSWSADGTSVSCNCPKVLPDSYDVVVKPQDGVASDPSTVTVIALPLYINGKPHPVIYLKRSGAYVMATEFWHKEDDVYWPYGIGQGTTPPLPPPSDDWPTGGVTIEVNPSTSLGRTVAAIQAAIDSAPALATVHVPGGAPWTGETDLFGKEYVRVKGDGIFKQSIAGTGGGGTWIKARLRWPAYSHFDGMLIGHNTSGRQCSHSPIERATTRTIGVGQTKQVGCRKAVFKNVRFKGGGEGKLYTGFLKGPGGVATTNAYSYRTAGASVFDFSSNYKRGWVTQTDGVGSKDMIENHFWDCEWERSMGGQDDGRYSLVTLSDGSTYLREDPNFNYGNPGGWLNGWWDCRSGGSFFTKNRWYRCHMGVKNGYHSGVEGYGIGTVSLLQASPTGPANSSSESVNWDGYVGGANPGTKERYNHPDCSWSTDGGSQIALNYPTLGYGAQPSWSTYANRVGNWNKNFDTDIVDHGPDDNYWEDCLFEYSNWHPLNPCDWARNYSVWRGCGTNPWSFGNTAYPNAGAGCLAGWGNPPGKNWVQTPDAMWNNNFSLTRCYSKGSLKGGSHMVGEVSRNCKVIDCNFTHNQTNRGTPTGTFSYGNENSGSFSNANRPSTALFTTDWSGSLTTYTPSPYDP